MKLFGSYPCKMGHAYQSLLAIELSFKKCNQFWLIHEAEQLVPRLKMVGGHSVALNKSLLDFLELINMKAIKIRSGMWDSVLYIIQ